MDELERTNSQSIENDPDMSLCSTASNISERSEYFAFITNNEMKNARKVLHLEDRNDDPGDIEATDDEFQDVDWKSRHVVMSRYQEDSKACDDLFRPGKYKNVKLPFVNREEQVAKFVACLVRTQVAYIEDPEQEEHHRRIIPFLDQMFGSGKTSLAIRALKIAKESLKWTSSEGIPSPHGPKAAYGQAICNELFPAQSPAEETPAEEIPARETPAGESQILTSKILFCAVESVVYSVDFHDISRYTRRDSRETDSDAKIVKILAGSLGIDTTIVDSTMIFSEGLRTITHLRKSKSFLLVVDEVYDANIDHIRDMWAFFTRQAARLSKENDPIQLHLAFCGRQTLFLSLGKGDKSPTSIEWILLPSLKLEHIKEIVEKLQQARHFPQLTFYRSDVREHFFDRLLNTTGGVPRIVYNVINALVRLFGELQKSGESFQLFATEEIDFIFDVVLFKGFSSTVPDRDKYCIAKLQLDSEGRRNLLQATFGMLLLSAETGHEVDIETEVQLSASREKGTIGELINRLPIFIDVGSSKKLIKVQLSQYVLRILSTSSSATQTSLRTLLSFISARCRPIHHGDTTQDPANLFELMLASRMAQHIEVSRSLGKPLLMPGLDKVLHYGSGQYTILSNAIFKNDVWPKVRGGDGVGGSADENGSSSCGDKKKSKSSGNNNNKKKSKGSGNKKKKSRKTCTPDEMADEIERLIKEMDQLIRGMFSKDSLNMQCHILLWSRTTVENFLGKNVMDEFDKIKAVYNDPQRKLEFIDALLRPHRTIFSNNDDDSDDFHRPAKRRRISFEGLQEGQMLQQQIATVVQSEIDSRLLSDSSSRIAPMAHPTRSFVSTSQATDNRIDVSRSMNEVDNATHTYIVLSNFESRSSGYLSVEEGESVRMLSERDDGWLEVTNHKRERGLVPSDLLEKIVDWNVERVVEWLRSHPVLKRRLEAQTLSEIGQIFAAEAINGFTLAITTDSILKDIGIKALSHRTEIIAARDRLFLT